MVYLSGLIQIKTQEPLAASPFCTLKFKQQLRPGALLLREDSTCHLPPSSTFQGSRGRTVLASVCFQASLHCHLYQRAPHVHHSALPTLPGALGPPPTPLGCPLSSASHGQCSSGRNLHLPPRTPGPALFLLLFLSQVTARSIFPSLCSLHTTPVESVFCQENSCPD